MEISLQQLIFAFGLTLFAGLSTGFGSAIALMAKRTNTRFLTVSLGFSAGVMIYVSFVEILQKSRELLSAEYGSSQGNWYAVLGFFGGILLIALIDKLIPDNPHEVRRVEEMDEQTNRNRLRRVGLMTALVIGIHNFPEGLATFTAALTDPALGVAIAIAIAIHNIPEGIAVAVPVYYSTNSRKKAFWLSFSSGLAEPVGALVGYAILLPFMSPLTFGLMFALIAGIMVFISLDELLPAAETFGEHHLAIYGLIGGMAVMALSLLLLY
ncbi:MAG: zinc transporter ZupT [Bacteroidia bacterium]|jgi:ZIP family zinc transporter|nr:zinc transporter ZupT [Bacteroidia bacterium]